MKRFFSDIKKYWYFCKYSAQSDLKAEVANSYLNWIWWVLEPLCNMLVYYFIFSNILNSSKDYYMIFIYSAILMWNFFNKNIIYSIKAIRTNKGIVTKVYVPKYILLLSNMMLNGIKLGISLLILQVFMIIWQVPVNWTIIYFFISYVVLFLFTFGCGTIFMHFGVFIDDLTYAISILLNLLFYLSGIFYDIETTMTPPLVEILVKVNPMAFLINSMRNALLYETAPDIVLMGLWLIVSVILCVVGVRIIYKYENSYVKVV